MRHRVGEDQAHSETVDFVVYLGRHRTSRCHYDRLEGRMARLVSAEMIERRSHWRGRRSQKGFWEQRSEQTKGASLSCAGLWGPSITCSTSEGLGSISILTRDVGPLPVRIGVEVRIRR